MDQSVKEQLLEDKKKLERERLGKKLAYLLRYGAEKEGLNINDQGFVEIEQLITVELLNGYTVEDVRNEIETSVSTRTTKRFETAVMPNGKLNVRATYGRRMERSPYHDGTSVKRLLFVAVDTVVDNVHQYNFSGFPDDYMLNLIIRRMKRRGCLSNKAMRLFLIPAMEHLDLWNVFVNEATLKLVPKKCPNLLTLNLYNCGYVITDHLLAQILKGLPHLLSINLHGCRHITNLSTKVIAKHCRSLKHLNLTFCTQVDQTGLLELIESIGSLEELNIYDFKGFSEANLIRFNTAVSQRSLRFEMARPIDFQSAETIFDSKWERINYR